MGYPKELKRLFPGNRPSRNLVGILVLAAFVTQLGLAADKTWTGTTDQVWNTAANWGGANPGNADRLIINLSTGNFPIITSANATAFNPGDVAIGSASGQTGRLDIRSGTLTQNVIGTTGNWFFVGGALSNSVGGTGTLNIADTSGTGGTLTGFAQGSGGLTIGKLWVGGRDNNSGTGTVNINTTGTIDAQSTGSGYSASIIVGSRGASTGVINMDSGTLKAAGQIWLANSNSTGSGTINLSGGTITALGLASVGRVSGTGNINITGGTFTSAGLQLAVSTGSSDTCKGNLTLTGGTYTSTEDVTVGVGVRALSVPKAR